MDAVALTAGCADAWSLKAIRSGMGAHFRTRVCTQMSWADMREYASRHGLSIRVAAATGISADGDADDTTRGKRARRAPQPETEVEVDMETETEMGMAGESAATADEDENEDGSGSTQTATECVDYAALDWCAPSAVVVGGEADGVSREALQAARQLVDIPMRVGVESLNAAMAGTVILFEARRQRRLRSLACTGGQTGGQTGEQIEAEAEAEGESQAQARGQACGAGGDVAT